MGQTAKNLPRAYVFPLNPRTRTLLDAVGTSHLCHQRKSALASGSSFLWSAHVRQQLKKLLVGRALRGPLDFPVTRDERKAKRREYRAAAIFAADLPLDGGAPAYTIDLVH